MSCTHPHIFRLSVRQAYHCLACGEAMIIIHYSKAKQ